MKTGLLGAEMKNVWVPVLTHVNPSLLQINCKFADNSVFLQTMYKLVKHLKFRNGH